METAAPRSRCRAAHHAAGGLGAPERAGRGLGGTRPRPGLHPHAAGRPARRDAAESTRDPILGLADLVIGYYNDWLLAAETMEPRRPGSIATLPIGRGSGGGSPVERFAIRRADLLEVLGVVGRPLKAAR